jgi:hypothetical protein
MNFLFSGETTLFKPLFQREFLFQISKLALDEFLGKVSNFEGDRGNSGI